MPNVYSELLGGSFLCGTGYTTLGAPVEGFKWIVKDLSVILWETDVLHSWPGFSVEDNLHLPIFSRIEPFCVGGVLYEWHGAQVIENGTYLYFHSLLGDWTCRASGYNLKLP